LFALPGFCFEIVFVCDGVCLLFSQICLNQFFSLLFCVTRLGEISPFGRIFKCLTDLGAIFCLNSPKFWLPFVFKILNLDKQSLGKNLYLVMLHFGRYFRQNWALFHKTSGHTAGVQ
jgi:hypothetical protein